MAIFTCEAGGLVTLLILEVTSCVEIRWRSSEGRSAQPAQLESDGTHAPPPGLVDPPLGPRNPAKEIPMRLMLRENAWLGWLEQDASCEKRLRKILRFKSDDSDDLPHGTSKAHA